MLTLLSLIFFFSLSSFYTVFSFKILLCFVRTSRITIWSKGSVIGLAILVCNKINKVAKFTVAFPDSADFYSMTIVINLFFTSLCLHTRCQCAEGKAFGNSTACCCPAFKYRDCKLTPWIWGRHKCQKHRFWEACWFSCSSQFSREAAAPPRR